MELRKAERKQVKIKLGIQGPAGSGKTFSSLLLAYGITGDWTKIAIVDTENHSADLYAHLGNYNVISLDSPFSPEKYIDAIKICEDAGMEAIIIDSISHEWEGQGGILEIHSNMIGNSFTNWNKVTPRHNVFVQYLLQSSCHIIATIRTKQDYVLNEKNGKFVPEKVGLKGVTREGLDYEFTIVFEVDIKHNATASKDRTGLYMDKPPFLINENTGKRIKRWCVEDFNINDLIHQISESEKIEQLVGIYNDYPLQRNQIQPYLTARKKELVARMENNIKS